MEVINLLAYKTFAELIEDVPARDLGYADSDKEDFAQNAVDEIKGLILAQKTA